jgi:hypothetical protein
MIVPDYLLFVSRGCKMTVISQQRNIAITRPPRWLHDKIHGTILAIDDELSVAKDAQYREMLVKAAYSLRNLAERAQIQDPCLTGNVILL